MPFRLLLSDSRQPVPTGGPLALSAGDWADGQSNSIGAGGGCCASGDGDSCGGASGSGSGSGGETVLFESLLSSSSGSITAVWRNDLRWAERAVFVLLLLHCSGAACEFDAALRRKRANSVQCALCSDLAR